MAYAYLEFFIQGQSIRTVNLTTQFQLVPRSRIRVFITPFYHIYVQLGTNKIYFYFQALEDMDDR